ncbi:transposase [Methylobacterium fujisawaense]|uniref:Transposase n=1 Tax=Methylobacterium fujisawaense TaxID=107400 RepID=A0ABR6D852_9HYPH|nr:transposase [Methylobacterium fujisawaense]MBA9062263.1 transposase [Methylobacterium fujisawaense]MDH3029060.1 transposase [Methylobacterium fujisawaense]
MQSRRAYPSDVSDEEWALVAPYLPLLPETATQREHSLREVFNGLRYVVRYGVHGTPANADDRADVAALADAVQEATGDSVDLAYVDQGYIGERAARAAADHRIALEVVKLSESKRGFVLLPRRWVVERAFAWMARFRRLASDYERLPATLAGLHLVAFSVLLLSRAADFATVRNSSNPAYQRYEKLPLTA